MTQCHYSAFCSNLSNAQRFVPVNGPAFEDSFSKKWVLENLRRLRVTQGLDGVPRRPRLCLFVDGVKNLSTYGCGMSITLRQGISRSRALTCCLVIRCIRFIVLLANVLDNLPSLLCVEVCIVEGFPTWRNVLADVESPQGRLTSQAMVDLHVGVHTTRQVDGCSWGCGWNECSVDTLDPWSRGKVWTFWSPWRPHDALMSPWGLDHKWGPKAVGLQVRIEQKICRRARSIHGGSWLVVELVLNSKHLRRFSPLTSKSFDIARFHGVLS